jgi:hypothetical protein
MVLKAKHIVEEVNGTRCTIVEKGASEKRIKFLKNLLEFNNYEVIIAEEAQANPEAPKTYTLAVTDIVFNPVIAVYERSLKTPRNQRVSPAFWEQLTDDSRDEYWEFGK